MSWMFGRSAEVNINYLDLSRMALTHVPKTQFCIVTIVKMTWGELSERKISSRLTIDEKKHTHVEERK